MRGLDTFALVCLLLVVGGLLYLEWLRQEELVELNARVVDLELERQRRTRAAVPRSRSPRTPKKPTEAKL